MIFKSKNSLKINKNIYELNDFLKNKTSDTIQRTSIFGETSYILSNDYDRFIIGKKAIPLKTSGIVEINLFLKVNEIDEHNSKIDYTIKYTNLSNLIIVAFYIIIISFTLFGSKFRFFGDSIIIASLFTKFILVIFEVSFISFCLWLGIKWSTKKFQGIIEELINPLKKSNTCNF
jgi:hypothetical protein